MGDGLYCPATVGCCSSPLTLLKWPRFMVLCIWARAFRLLMFKLFIPAFILACSCCWAIFSLVLGDGGPAGGLVARPL